MSDTTTRRLLPRTQLTDTPPNIVTSVGSLADAVDNFGIDLFGLAANRPTIGAGAGQMSAEDDGTTYYSTDTKVVERYRHGTGWEQLVGQRGFAIIDTEEQRLSSTMGLMFTPDRVQGIVIPSLQHLLKIRYKAEWKASVGTLNASAAIFVGANQMKGMIPTLAAPATIAASLDAAANVWHLLGTTGSRLSSWKTPSPGGFAPGSYPGDHSSDPQVFGGGGGQIEWFWRDVLASGSVLTLEQDTNHAGELVLGNITPGTYDISVQFACQSGGIVSAKNRRLLVKVEEF